MARSARTPERLRRSADRRRRPGRRPGAGSPVPELPEVEVVRRGLERWVAGRTIAAAEVLHPRAVRRHVGRPGDFAARLTGPHRHRRRAGGASTCGCRSPSDDALAGAPGHERPAARRRARQGRTRSTCAPGSPSPTAAATCASSTSAPSARPGAPSTRPPGGRRRCPPPIAHIAPTRWRPPSTTRRSSRAPAPPADRGQAGAARPVADQRRRQHLRRRGAVAGPAALAPGPPRR